MTGSSATPALSVAMSVYNAERFLDEAIRSIRDQSHGDFEFLILNDGSVDDSRAIIDRHAAQDDRIIAIHRENRGLVASLNQLLDLARAPIVARMDADDIAHPDRFARQLAFLADHPDYGVIGSWTTDIDENGGFLSARWCRPPRDPPRVPRIGEWRPSAVPLPRPRSDWPRCARSAAITAHSAIARITTSGCAWPGITRLGSLPERLLQYRHTPEQVSSRHAVEQQTGAAIAYLAFRERQAGRPDPTATLTRLPPIAELDALFGRAGVAEEVRARVAPNLLYSETALSSEGYALLLDHVREGGRTRGLWRTVARLAKLGHPARAARLAATLAVR